MGIWILIIELKAVKDLTDEFFLYLESSFANELQQRFFHSIKQILDEFTVLFVKRLRKSIEPWDKQWLPSEHVGLHVNHTTATHLQWSIYQASISKNNISGSYTSLIMIWCKSLIRSGFFRSPSLAYAQYWCKMLSREQVNWSTCGCTASTAPFAERFAIAIYFFILWCMVLLASKAFSELSRISKVNQVSTENKSHTYSGWWSNLQVQGLKYQVCSWCKLYDFTTVQTELKTISHCYDVLKGKANSKRLLSW